MEQSQDEKLRTTFGQRIESLLKIKGMSQKELAGLTGVSEANLSKIIKGKINTSLEVSVLLADALGVTLNDLIPVAERVRAKKPPGPIPERIHEGLLEAVSEYRRKGMAVPEEDIWELAMTHARGKSPGKNFYALELEKRMKKKGLWDEGKGREKTR
ncbi:MAG: helix-turn-helix domain-containing protein [Deltaproteobacteria bacterium]|nr:MAG: helix-turn-helix domain-containing protein [Deltaproteobacteria bacterium]